jgi:hypothetical protein
LVDEDLADDDKLDAVEADDRRYAILTLLMMTKEPASP